MYRRGTGHPEIPKILIQRHVAQVCRSPRFRDAAILQRLLRFLVEYELSNEVAEPTAALIASEVFKLGKDFRSKSDSRVRVATNRLRNALDHYNAVTASEIIISLLPGTYRPEITLNDAPPELCATALNTIDWYLGVVTPAAHQKALTSTRFALSRYKENAELLAGHADLLMDGWRYRYTNSPKDIERAFSCLETALQIDPHNLRARWVMAHAELLEGNDDSVRLLGHNLLMDNDHEAVTHGAWLLTVIAGRSDLIGGKIPQVACDANMPGWMQHAPFLTNYVSGDYERALDAAIKFGMHDWFWGYFERAAALGQLGLKDVAKLQLTELFNRYPYLASDPINQLANYIPVTEVREHVFEGLEKAGIREWMA